MIKGVDRAYNLENLQKASRMLSELEHAIFFGTLLGFEREGNIIENDDDVDIYVNIKHRDEVIYLLGMSEFTVDFSLLRNQSPFFLQGERRFGKTPSYVDFYFYSDDDELDYIVEKWNFHGQWQSKRGELHVPKELFFPIVTSEMQGFEVKTPAKPAKLCEFLYGASWKTPMSKGSEYHIIKRDNRPVFVPK